MNQFILPFLLFLSAIDLGFADVKSSNAIINRELLESLNNYEVVIPKQFADDQMSKRPGGFQTRLEGDEGKHLDRVDLTVEIGDKLYKLIMHLNTHMLLNDFTTSRVLENGQIVMAKPSTDDIEMCYYHGYVEGVPHSKVFMSTCDGLRGTIIALDETIFIEPMYIVNGRGDVNAREHIAYRPQDMKKAPNGSCGHNDENDMLGILNKTWNDAATSNQDIHSRHARDISETLFVQLLVVADSNETRKYGNDTVIRRILQMVNVMDGYYLEFKIRIILIHIELWEERDPIEFSRNAATVLGSFRTYRNNRKSSSDSPWKYADHAALLYGGDLTGSTIGIAFVGGMCSELSVSVTEDYYSNTLFPATVMTHEVGHNFGMNHDNESICGCKSDTQCIMSASVSVSNPKFSWSDCSHQALIRNYEFGTRSCLFDVPSPRRIFGVPQCGNQVIEEGEECDCGPVGICNSTCCNATSCQLFLGAVCDSGLCCRNCQLLPAGTMCRESGSQECGIAEYCSGHSEKCPENLYIEDGTSCNSGLATCFEGICSNRDTQCKYFWGPDALSCDTNRYSVNRYGSKYGNCGINQHGNFTACTPQNYLCGKLLCYNGNDKPFLAKYWGDWTRNSDNIICQVILSDPNTDMVDPYLVRTGTMCAPGKVCSAGVCKEFPMLPCTDNCNSNGVCNNKIECHCQDGFAPPYCNATGYGGSQRNGPISLSRISVSFSFQSVYIREGENFSACARLSAPNGPLVSNFSFSFYTVSDSENLTLRYNHVQESEKIVAWFPSGSRQGATRCFDISIFDDEFQQTTEYFLVRLSDFFNGNAGDVTTARIYILDDETGENVQKVVRSNGATAPITTTQPPPTTDGSSTVFKRCEIALTVALLLTLALIIG